MNAPRSHARIARALALGVTLAASLAIAPLAFAQEQTPNPATAPAQSPAPTRDAQPTLDELLGLPDAAPRPDDAPTDPNQPRPSTSQSNLDRHLAPDQPEKDPFKIAVELMDESAKRLSPSTADAGLDTQRLQEEAILRLDQLIAQAKKQQSKPKPKPNQQQQQQQQPQNQNQQQDASSQRQQQANPSSQAAQDTQSGPAGQQPQTRTPPAGAGAAWGSLPDHVRDALLQGSSDRFSSAYRGLTEEYYKRLAQDPASRGSSPTPSRPESRPQPAPQ